MRNLTVRTLLAVHTLFISAHAFGDGSPGRLVTSARLSIPYGKSTWTGSLPTILSSPIAIRFASESSCTNPTTGAEVRLQGTQTWVPTTRQAGFDYFEGGPIDAVHLTFDQRQYQSVICELRIYDPSGEVGHPPTNPPLGQERFVGVLEYQGGFVRHLAIDLDPSGHHRGYVVKYVKFDIPPFCRDATILEAYNLGDSVWDRMTSIGNNLFKVDYGASFRTHEVRATFNGPTSLSCDIPVYVYL